MKASKDIDRARYHLRYQESQDSSWDFQLLFELFAGFVGLDDGNKDNVYQSGYFETHVDGYKTNITRIHSDEKVKQLKLFATLTFKPEREMKMMTMMRKREIFSWMLDVVKK